jgi:hypothetical protein
MTIPSWFWSVLLVLGSIAIIQILNRLESRRRAEREKFENVRMESRVRTIRKFYLETLQRELANIILNEDLETFEKTFYWMRNWESEISRSDSEWRIAEYDLLLKTFPNLEDFDLVGTKHFVRYDDRPLGEIEESADRYKEISKFLVLDRSQDPFASRDLQYGDRETEIFRKRIQQYKDKRLRDDLNIAMTCFHKRRDDQADFYEDNEYRVTPLWRQPHRDFSPDNQYGIFCKKLNEYGVYTFFAADDDKTYHSYYRSDAAFSNQGALMP